jgi:hypothetical protein
LEVAVGPAIAFLVVGGFLGLLAVLQSTSFRMWAIIVGALVTFQSQSGALKLGYLGLALVCVAVAFRDLAQDQQGSLILHEFRPYLLASLGVAGYFALSIVIAVGNGNSLLNWARDSSAYLFALALPIIGLQAGLALRRRTALTVFVAAGLVSTVSFVLQWLTNRELLEVGRVAYGDNFLSGALFCLCLAYGAGGRHPLLGQLAAASCLGSLVLTGNRSLVVLLLAFAGVGGVRRRLRMPIGTAFRSLVLFAVGIAAVLMVSFQFIPGERDLLAQRVSAAQTYVQTGEDQSARSRSIQAGLAREQFKKSPIFGTGPGHVYVDPYYIPNVSDPKKGRRDSLSLDTPLVIPAKLGLVGTMLLIAWAASIAVSVRNRLRTRPTTVVENAMRGFAVIAIAFIPFGVTLEQKGFALTLMLFACILISQTAQYPETSSASVRPRESASAGI